MTHISDPVHERIEARTPEDYDRLRRMFNARRAFGQGSPRGFVGTASESGTTSESEHKRLMKKWYGLTPMEDDWTYPCLYRLWGLHTPALDIDDVVDEDPFCCCHFAGHQGISDLVWDHVRGWYTADRHRTPVVTVEPYGFPRVREVMDYVAPLGLRVGFEGRSPYGASYVLFLVGPDLDKEPWRSLAALERERTTGS